MFLRCRRVGLVILARMTGPPLLTSLLILLLYTVASHAQFSPPPVALSTTNASAVIATGGTFQQIIPSVSVNSSGRRSVTVQNNNTNNDNCWVFIGATGSATAATSILLLPGGSYQRYFPYVPSDVISATCSGNGDTIYADYQ